VSNKVLCRWDIRKKVWWSQRDTEAENNIFSIVSFLSLIFVSYLIPYKIRNSSWIQALHNYGKWCNLVDQFRHYSPVAGGFGTLGGKDGCWTMG
jgi:hypothetical protein